MSRSVNVVAARERRKKILKLAKGNYGARKNVWTVAKNTVEKGLVYAYRDRKQKKRNFRALWIVRISAGARAYGMSYSVLMGLLGYEAVFCGRIRACFWRNDCAAAYRALLMEMPSPDQIIIREYAEEEPSR